VELTNARRGAARVNKVHRIKLSPAKRKLGDAYVKKEFRDHRTAQPAFVKGFLAEWARYARDLETMSDVGRALPADVASKLSPEQLQTLQRLEIEARSLKR